MEILVTKDSTWLQKWDDFLVQNPRGHYNQLSEWLKSYTVYGFDYAVILLVKGDVVVGGCGIIIAKFSFFKFVILPAGPIINSDCENYLEKLFQEIYCYANKIKACYLQINLPILKNKEFSKFTISRLNANSFYTTGSKGILFKYVISINGFRFVNLSDKNPQKKYNTNTKRNISKSLQNGLQFNVVTTEADVQLAYQCIENNAATQGYLVRNFNSFKKYLLALVEKKQAIFAVCYYENKMVGSLFLINCGKRLTYISGGTNREYNDLKIGHFLHYKIIELSIEMNLEVYDISVGGTDGVLQFKKGFGSIHSEFEGAMHWILKPKTVIFFQFFERYLKPHKAKIALILSKLKSK